MCRTCLLLRAHLFAALALVFVVGFAPLSDCAEPPKVFCLTTAVLPSTRPADPEREDWFTPNLLVREIVRQGVLLAARESFGLPTRDATLREPLADAAGAGRFDCEIRHVQAKRVDYVLRQGERVLLDGSFRYQFGHAHSVEAMQADAVEALSRGEFRDALAQAGFERRKKAYQLDAPLPAEIEAALARLDLFLQYEAVRLAHRQMEEQGESMALLGALTRGYANLAQLTAYHHSSMRHAFAARALLYGTRLIRISKESPIGYWHRAYAFTLIGLTRASMFDLEAAEKLVQEHAPAAKPPSWLKLIHLANEYDCPRLNLRVRDRGEDLPLAALLWFRSVEFSNSPALTIEVAKRTLEVNPLCLRIMHGADRVAGVSYQHMTTAAIFQMHAACALQRLPQVAKKEPRLANMLRVNSEAELASPNGRTSLARDLVNAAGVDSDLEEPSLAVLGRLMNEEDVLHVGMRAYFLRDQLGVDSKDFLDEMQEVYREHPLGFLISSLRVQRGLPPAQFEAVVAQAEVKESNIVSSGPMFGRMPRDTRFGNTTIGEYNTLRWQHLTGNDIEYQVRISTNTSAAARVQMAHWMFDMNPHAPYRYVVLIEDDWENSQKHLAEWEERYAQHPAVALALAKQFEREADDEKAEAYYTDYIGAVADYNVYVRLARLHYRRGDKEKMLEVAEEFLEQEDYGLSHASMSRWIAQTLMTEAKYEEALPWAERSARSYSAWGLHVLANCYEGLGKLSEAEALHKAIDERYETSSLYDFLARTGHGNLEEAWKLKQNHLRKYLSPDSLQFRLSEVYHLAYRGRMGEAIVRLNETFEATGDPVTGLVTAALAARDDGPLARQTLEAVLTNGQLAAPEASPLKEFVDLIQRISNGQDAEFDRIDELAKSPPNVWHLSHFLAASFLEAGGDTPRAIEHYRESARSPLRENFTVILAWARLRDLGENPLKLAPYYPTIEAAVD